MPFTIDEYAEGELRVATPEMLADLYAALKEDPDLEIWVTMPPSWYEDEIAEEIQSGDMIDLGNGQYCIKGTADYHNVMAAQAKPKKAKRSKKPPVVLGQQRLF